MFWFTFGAWNSFFPETGRIFKYGGSKIWRSENFFITEYGQNRFKNYLYQSFFHWWQHYSSFVTNGSEKIYFRSNLNFFFHGENSPFSFEAKIFPTNFPSNLNFPPNLNFCFWSQRVQSEFVHGILHFERQIQFFFEAKKIVVCNVEGIDNTHKQGPEFKQSLSWNRAFSWRVRGGKFCLQFFYGCAFCPCGLPLFQLRCRSNSGNVSTQGLCLVVP